MKKTEKSIIKTLSYIALMIIALLLAVEGILPLVGVVIKGALLNILNTIRNVLILIVVGVNAHSFTDGRAKWVEVLFWIAIIIVIVATVLMWL